MVDTRIAALGVVALLVVSLFILVRPQGQPQPETASACPANQFVQSEDATGNLTCSTSPNQFDRVGLVGWWPFVENTGTSAYDISTNLNTGTLFNGPTWGGGNCPFGSGGCLNFTRSSSQYISASSTGLPSGNGLTISVLVWVNAVNCFAGGQNSPFYYGPYNGNANTAGIRLNGNTCSLAFNGFNNDFDTGFAVPTKQWSLVGFTLSGGTALVMYYNGVNKGGTTLGLTENVASGSTLYFGVQGGTGGQFMNGHIGEIRIYNRVLSATEISALYAYGIGALPNPVHP